jgi:hypothetical protein
MASLNWIPEKYPQAGGIAAEGFIQLLGQPNLSILELLVRETTQNSWDARARKGRVEIEFKHKLLQKNSRELRSLKENFFAQRPTSKQFESLHRTLSKDSIPLLIIRDINTAGLGGVTRADRAPAEGTFNRYRRFLLNIGEQHHPELGGGAYGYGRSICFRASSCRTAVIYTRTDDDLDVPESRIVVVSYGPEFEKSSTRYTGRHWWTTAGSEGLPTVGRKADQFAQSIGLKPYGENERGTTVAVIDPDLDMPSDEICETLALSILYHLWPKFASLNGNKGAMTFRVMNDEKLVPISAPETHPILKNYVAALAHIKKLADPSSTAELPLGMKCHKVLTRHNAAETPKTLIGHLVEFKYPKLIVAPTNYEAPDSDEVSVLSDLKQKFESLTHHVAIMRTPDLVVNYVSVPVANSDDISIGGVFRSTDGLPNERLRKSEPPAHDDWNINCSDKDAKTTARRTMKVIENVFFQKSNSSSISSHGGDNKGALAIGGAIGELIWSEIGDAPGGPGTTTSGGGTSGNGGGGKPRSNKTVISLDAPVMKNAKGSVLTASWRVEFGPSKKKETYSVEVRLLTGDGEKTEELASSLSLPRISTISRSSSSTTKTPLINALVHNVTPSISGETFDIEVNFERGTVPTIILKLVV